MAACGGSRALPALREMEMQESDVGRIERKILAFVKDGFPAASQCDLQVDTELFREGIVDSIGILSLLRFLEQDFGLEIDPVEMVLENFASVAAMRNLVISKQGLKRGGGRLD